MGGGSSGSQNITQTTKVQLPKWAEPTAKELLSRSSALSKTPYVAYPWLMTAGPTAEHEAALQGITARAMAGSPVMLTAQSNLVDTLLGRYLAPESNPYLQRTYEQAAGDLIRQYNLGTAPQIQAAANRAGAFGGSAHQLLLGESQRGLGENLARLATDLYSKNYADERQRQMQAMFFAPSMAQADYQDMQALMGAGDIRRQFGQDFLNELKSRWYEERQYPYSQLGFLAQMIPAAIGQAGTTTTTMPNPNYVSPVSNILGGALGGIGTGYLVSSLLPPPFNILGGVGTGLATLLGSIFK